MKDYWFENDVNMYGIQTRPPQEALNLLFENDVNMYGIQTDLGLYWLGCSLRMM